MLENNKNYGNNRIFYWFSNFFALVTRSLNPVAPSSIGPEHIIKVNR